MMKVNDFINMLIKAEHSNTVYCTGMFGQPITEKVINDKAKQYPANYSFSKVSQLKRKIGKNYFGFDCVCLIKAILWGWTGDSSKENGGAKYNSNNVPDVNTEGLYAKCETSTDFNKIVPGALVWMQGHVGVYIGGGDVIECTAAWTGNVLRSKLGNLGYKGDKVRNWKGWGKLPYVDYGSMGNSSTASNVVTSNTTTTIVQSGEGYYQIAKRLGMVDKYKEIAALNNNKALHVGDTVIVPVINKNSNNNSSADKKDTLYDSYVKFVSELKVALNLTSNATIRQVYEATPTLKNDNKYNKVTVVLQKYLIALGISCGSKGANGYFGNDTEKAVRTYQEKYKTGVVDGYLSAKGKMWKSLLML